MIPEIGHFALIVALLLRAKLVEVTGPMPPAANSAANEDAQAWVPAMAAKGVSYQGPRLEWRAMDRGDQGSARGLKC